MTPRVLISDALSPAAVQIFKDRGIEVDFQPKLGADKEKLAELVGGFDGLAIRSATKVTPKILEKAKNLKVIGRAGIGVDNVDIPAATAKGIIVMNTPFGNSITTAEHAITLMLALARQIPQADTSTQAGKWEKNRFMGVEITGKALGVIGAGNIGSIVVNRALGLHMRVIAYDPFLSPERAVDIGVHKVELDELFRRADFITLHTPLTEKTKNIVDAAAFASDAFVCAKPQSIHGVSAATSERSTVQPHQMRKPGGASRWVAMSNAAPSFSISATRSFTKAHCASAASDVTAGSTILRHTEVFERVAATSARFATHGVFSTQSWSTLAFASARAIRPLSPPADFAQASVSR